MKDAAPCPVIQGGEISPEVDVVADARPGGKSASIMDSLDSKITLTTAKRRMRWHWNGRRGGCYSIIGEEDEKE